eukprot:4330627-Amphidinium_carterae.1
MVAIGNQFNTTLQSDRLVSVDNSVKTLMHMLSQACLQIEATIPEKTKASPQWSVGSALHASELCSPCAWVWKSRGWSFIPNSDYHPAKIDNLTALRFA